MLQSKESDMTEQLNNSIFSGLPQDYVNSPIFSHRDPCYLYISQNYIGLLF